MITIGEPDHNNQLRIEKIQNVLKYNNDKFALDENFLVKILSKDMSVLDIGKSLRNKVDFVNNRVKKLDTLDINVYEDYPDIQMDLCEKAIIPAYLKYDLIFCFSLLEHCYNPFVAANNLCDFLKPQSKIIGSVPFLFPYHCPKNLEYQDYFRFTRESLIALFPNAKNISVYSHRGRVGAGLNIISQKYKDIVEKRIPLITSKINDIDRKRKPEHSSGFDFIIEI